MCFCVWGCVCIFLSHCNADCRFDHKWTIRWPGGFCSQSCCRQWHYTLCSRWVWKLILWVPSTFALQQLIQFYLSSAGLSAAFAVRNSCPVHLNLLIRCGDLCACVRFLFGCIWKHSCKCMYFQTIYVRNLITAALGVHWNICIFQYCIIVLVMSFSLHTSSSSSPTHNHKHTSWQLMFHRQQPLQ